MSDSTIKPFALAWADLRRQGTMTFLSIVGVMGTATLSFVQLGLLFSLITTATLLYQKPNFHLILVSSEYLELGRPGRLPRARLGQVQAVPGVKTVMPLTVGRGLWRDPRKELPSFGQNNSIVILAVPPHLVGEVFRPREHVFASQREQDSAESQLARLDTALIDRTSHPEFGRPEHFRPRNAWTGGAGTEALFHLNGRPIEGVGTVTIGTGFSYNGLAVVSEETFGRFTKQDNEYVTFGLIQLERGQDPALVRAAIKDLQDEGRIPRDVQVFTSEGIRWREVRFWIVDKPVGFFFVVGVFIAALVGVSFISQVMVRAVRNRQADYATIKALGHEPSYLNWIVRWQSLLLFLGGYVLALLISRALYYLIWWKTRLPIEIIGWKDVLVLVLTLVVCLASGRWAMKELRKSDPAILF